MKNSDYIRGRALKINRSISARDIVNPKYTESYHDIQLINPMPDILQNFAEEVFSKNTIVTNDWMGYGSSRELPARLLSQNGIVAIIAKSFFTPFYKNALNLGLLCIKANTDVIDDDDELSIDLKMSYIQNKTKKILKK